MNTSAKKRTKNMKPWNKLTQAEKEARVHAAYGKYKGMTGGTEEFLREKHDEMEREEREFQRLYPGK